MKKIFQYIGLVGICLFSFYYTEKIALYVKMKNPLMKEINSIKDDMYVNSIDSTLINDIYIIPGLNGKEVDIDKSFVNMKEDNVLNINQLVYSPVTPKVSLEDHKERIIIRGNENKNCVSLIFEEDNDLAKYMYQEGYVINLLINKENYNTNYELINNSTIASVYNNIEKYLNKNNINKKLCYVKENNEVSKLCQNKYLFKSSLIINHSNLGVNKKRIKSGEIILIEKSLSLSELTILLDQINYQSLKIVPLSTLISEEN